MQAIELENTINQTFPKPKSNRAIAHADYFTTLILMMHEGSFQLDHVANIVEDKALCTLLGLENIPSPSLSPSTLGGWLRRMGEIQFIKYWHEVNKVPLKAALHHCKAVTLDIDATEIIAHKSSAK